jgi:hypothetical protein
MTPQNSHNAKFVENQSYINLKVFDHLIFYIEFYFE